MLRSVEVLKQGAHVSTACPPKHQPIFVHPLSLDPQKPSHSSLNCSVSSVTIKTGSKPVSIWIKEQQLWGPEYSLLLKNSWFGLESDAVLNICMSVADLHNKN